MIRSMTGYGRHCATIDGREITVEIRSVNHRFFEYSSRLPRVYLFLDDKLKSFLQTAIFRGKTEIFVSIDSAETSDIQVAVNVPLAKAYAEALQEVVAACEVRDDTSAMNLARFPDVLTVRKAQTDEEALTAAVLQVAQTALDNFIAMREKEGARLREDVLARREWLLGAVAKVEERSPITVKEHMQKVETRMKELLSTVTVDEQRLLTEAALFADKIATAEETVRLRSHLDQLETLVNSDEPIGRKLDFLIQEINRETNTIGSKAQDLQLAQVVVDMKSEIEKIREQIQNIE